MIKPLKSVWFFIIVGIFLVISMIAIPEGGFDIHIQMPTFSEMLTKDTTEYADISELTEHIEDIDSLPDITAMMPTDSSSTDTIILQDTVRANASELAQSIYRLQFPKNNKANLMKFFDKLNSKKNVRVMHYGDSQIEGDRMTSYIRNKLQKKFGGSGPGLLPALQPYDSYFSIDQSNEGQWKRYAIFGKLDTNVKHNSYGPLAAFTRFAPIYNDSAISDTTQYSASIIFKESKMSYGTVRKFQKIEIYYGNTKHPVSVKLIVDEQIVNTGYLNANTNFAVYEFTLAKASKNLKIEFSGKDSPDIYGIALDGLGKISVDNIGLRGSSGTVFKKMNFGHLAKSYQALDVDLFILQFGGNVMPYIKDSAQAINYGRWFKSQLLAVRKAKHDASYIVIGPSDMSYKQGDKFVTYPFLELVRDELRKASLAAGYAYWDMYEAMGGFNSMPSWVNAEPALAGADYTHFTPRGAKLVANMFYNALMIEGISNRKRGKNATPPKSKLEVKTSKIINK